MKVENDDQNSTQHRKISATILLLQAQIQIAFSYPIMFKFSMKLIPHSPQEGHPLVSCSLPALLHRSAKPETQNLIMFL